jgi:hypothetical protein
LKSLDLDVELPDVSLDSDRSTTNVNHGLDTSMVRPVAEGKSYDDEPEEIFTEVYSSLAPEVDG